MAWPVSDAFFSARGVDTPRRRRWIAEASLRLVLAGLAVIVAWALSGGGAQAADGAVAAERPPLILRFENKAPNNYADPETGRFTGRNYTLLANAIAALNETALFELRTWSRAFTLATETPNACVFSTVRTAEREPLFTWLGPLNTAEPLLIASASGRATELADLEAARPFIIGGYTGDFRVTMLQKLGGYNLDIVRDDALNPPKLRAGRIDLWFTDRETFENLEGLDQDAFRIVLRLEPETLYLACNLETDPTRLEALNAMIQVLRDDSLETSPPERR